MEGEKVLKQVADCSACGGTGWMVQRDEATAAAVPCPQCRSFLKTTRLLDRAGIPPRYLERGFDVYSIHDPLQERALKRSIEFVENYPRVERGLLFVGPCGVGKTHLSVAILKTLIEEKQVPARFVDETELLRRLQYSYQPNSQETEKEVMAPIMETDLIVWDDLGTGRPTEWVKETMRTVINYRYTYNKHTIFTTNWLLATRPVSGTTEETSWLGGKFRPDGATLAERIGVHLHSRILEMCEIVEVKGPDARTEIHKAGYDFQNASEARRSLGQAGEDPLQVPSGLLKCPQCRRSRVIQQDVSPVRRSDRGRDVEIACLCRPCGEQFLARFDVDQVRVEYPEID